MPTFPAPAKVNGAALRAELAAAGVTVGEFDFHTEGGTLHFPTVDPADEDTVRQVVEAHTGAAMETEEQVAEREFRAAIEAASSIADLKAALLGGSGGRPVVRPT